MPTIHFHGDSAACHTTHYLHPDLVSCSSGQLRQVSQPVSMHNKFESVAAWRKLNSTLESVRTYHSFRHCTGLAAIQIGIPLRQCVIWTPQLGYVHIANPEILEYTAEMRTEYEGCLSFFDTRGKVSRPNGIFLRYLQQDFSVREQSFTGWAARIIQHEIDHMNGILYTDRMKAGERPIGYEDYLILKAAG